jgi:hypothetical protein
MPQDIVRQIQQLMASDEKRHQEEMQVLSTALTPAPAVVRVETLRVNPSRRTKPA